MALLEANRHRGTEEGVSQWDFDDAGGRISAIDNDGNLVMAFEVGPLFGPRLAAAFGSQREAKPAPGPAPDDHAPGSRRLPVDEDESPGTGKPPQ